MKIHYIPVELFSKRYGVTIDSVYAYKHNSKHKNNGIKMDNGRLFVDENYFVRRKEFKIKIRMLAQENYYFITASIPAYQLAEFLSKHTRSSVQSWVMFMSKDLFRVENPSILYINSFTKLWQFFRVTRALIRAAFKTVGIPKNERDYNKLYDYKYGKVA